METRKIERVYDVELRAKEENGQLVEGYALVFNARTDLGFFEEEIDQHALDNCDMSDVYLLFNHDENQVLAGTSNGSLNMRVDEHGLLQTSEIVDTNIGKDIFKLVKNGLIRKMSFAFSIDEDGGQVWEQHENKDLRIIKKIKKLYDVSLVTYPAYSQTSAYARSNQVDEYAKEYLKRKEQDLKLKELLKNGN